MRLMLLVQSEKKKKEKGKRNIILGDREGKRITIDLGL